MHHCIIKYEELQRALSQIKKIKKKKNIILQLIIKPDILKIDATGMAFNIPCKFEGMLTLVVPFQQFFILVNDLEDDWIKLEFDNNYINLGSRRIESPFIKIEHPENHRRIKLPINYSLVELLSLRERYSIEELEKNNLYKELLKAEEKLSENIYRAIESLKKYGVTHKELSNIIEKKVQLIVKQQN